MVCGKAECHGKMKPANTRKLSVFGIDIEIDTESKSSFHDNNDSDCYFVMQQSVLQGLIKTLLCRSCKWPGLSLDLLIESSFGFSMKGKGTVIMLLQS